MVLFFFSCVCDAECREASPLILYCYSNMLPTAGYVIEANELAKLIMQFFSSVLPMHSRVMGGPIAMGKKTNFQILALL